MDEADSEDDDLDSSSVTSEIAPSGMEASDTRRKACLVPIQVGLINKPAIEEATEKDDRMKSDEDRPQMRFARIKYQYRVRLIL